MAYKIQRADNEGSTVAVHEIGKAIALRDQFSENSETRYTISEDDDPTQEELFLGNIITTETH